MANGATGTGFVVEWGGLESVTGPTVRDRVPGIEPFAEYGTEASIGNVETTKIVISVDTAWRSACANCMDAEIEDIERRLVTETCLSFWPSIKGNVSCLVAKFGSLFLPLRWSGSMKN